MNNLQSRAARSLRPATSEPRESETESVGTVATPKPVVGKSSRYVPFTGKADLPPYSTVRGRIVLGEPRYVLLRGTGKRYKLLSYRRSPAGVERLLVRVLTNGGTDKPLFDTLKKAGIPGAF